MRTFIRVAWLLLLPCGLAALAATPQQVAAEWPSIPPEELAMKDDPYNAGAKAIVLYREVAKDDAQAHESIHFRIKILTDEGRSYGSVEIPYAEKVISVEDIRARVVEPDGRTVEFHGQVFDKLIVKARKIKVQVKTFTLPDVQKGSIIEYSYLARWHSKPPDVLKHPQNYMITGTSTMSTTHWVIPYELFVRRSRFTFRPLPGAKVVWTSVGISREQGPVRQPDGSFLMQVDNVPGFPEEEYMPPEDALKACVDIFYVVGFIQDARDFWATYVQRYAEAIEPLWRDSKVVRRVVEETVSANDPSETKLRKLYDRAQQFAYAAHERRRTQKDSSEPYRPSKNTEDLLKRGYGAGNDINLLLVALARAAGFTAAPVLITARDRSLFRANLMDGSQLNAMVSWVQIGSKDYYLDPPALFCPFDLLPWNETATEGYRVQHSGGLLITTPDPKSENAVIERKGSFKLDDEGTLEGRLKVIFAGQDALERRQAGRDDDDSGRRKALVDEVKSWLPAGSSVDLTDLNKWEQSAEPLSAEFAIRVPNYGSRTGKRLLAPVGVFQTGQKPKFQSARRIHPVYFPYPYRQVDEIELLLPAGLKVQSLPQPRNQTTPFGHYEISSQNDGGVVRVNRRLVMDRIIFRTDSYPELRAFYNGARAGDEQQIVLQHNAQADSSDHK